MLVEGKDSFNHWIIEAASAICWYTLVHFVLILLMLLCSNFVTLVKPKISAYSIGQAKSSVSLLACHDEADNQANLSKKSV